MLNININVDVLYALRCTQKDQINSYNKFKLIIKCTIIKNMNQFNRSFLALSVMNTLRKQEMVLYADLCGIYMLSRSSCLKETFIKLIKRTWFSVSSSEPLFILHFFDIFQTVVMKNLCLREIRYVLVNMQ